MPNVGIPQSPQNQPSENPIMGLFLDRPAHTMDPKAFQACNNVRIELGRVRSDLIGWQAGPFASGTSLLPYIYLDSFTNSASATIQIGVTPTDVLKLDPTGGAPTYITPTYITGAASVNNGSTSVTGTNTRWATDIQFGAAQDLGIALAANASLGANVVTIAIGNTTPPTWLTGLPIFSDVAGAIPAGTFINNVQSSGGAWAVTLSQTLQAALTTSNHLSVGNSVVLRQNVRVGDQIAFNTTLPGKVGALTWYTVTAVGSDTGLTISPAYSGSNLTTAQYVIRQCLTNTISTSLPLMSSDLYISAGGYGGYPATATGAPTIPLAQGSDEWFFTNGIDPLIVYFDAQGTCQYSKTIPFTIAALKQYRGLMVYGGLIQPKAQVGSPANPIPLPSSITSSDSGFPLQTSSGVAFQGIATSGPFKISRIGILGSALMLYGVGEWTGGSDNVDEMSGVVTSASFVGFPTIWSFSDVIQTRGPVSGNAVVIFSDRHQFLSIDGEYRYNGLFVQIMNDHIWRAVLKNFDTNRPNSVVASIIPTYGDIIWAIPQTTDPPGQIYASTAFVEHYMEQANSYLFKPFSQRDFPFWAVASYQLAPSNLPTFYAADNQGHIWQLYASNKQNGVAPLATVTWSSRPIGNGRNRVLVTRVYPEIEYMPGGGSVSVTLTMQDAAAGPVTIIDTQTFNPNYAGNRFTNHFRRGRQASVTFSDTSGLGWIAQGYDWDYVTGGER